MMKMGLGGWDIEVHSAGSLIRERDAAIDVEPGR